MGRTKEEVQKAFGLAELPDDAFMALLEELGEGDVLAGVAPVEGEGYTAEELEQELEEAIVAESIGDLLARAREQSGKSLRAAGRAAGISHTRVSELERSSNIEIATLARVADTLGYDVKIVLEPKQGGGRIKRMGGKPQRTLTAELKA